MIYRNPNSKLAHRQQSNFWVGVIEDRNDPEKMGRVRVRVVGLHTDDRNELPTAGLPWAMVCMPPTSPSMNGIGHTPFLLEGSWVIVTFFDIELQEPLILGSILSIPEQRRDKQHGFTDPRGHYPRKSQIGHPDVNARARGIKSPDLTKTPIGNEPEDPYEAKYPYNHVFESESGHIIEIDDTPNHERINLWHRTGTSIEIHPNGDMQIRSIDQYNTSKTLHINTADNIIVTCGGDANVNVQGDTRLFSSGNIDMQTKQDFSVIADNDINISAKRNLNLQSESETTMHANSDIDIATGGTLDSTSVKGTNVVGNPIHLNSPSRSASNPGITLFDLDVLEIELDVNAAPERYRSPDLTELRLPNQIGAEPPPPDPDMPADVAQDSPSEVQSTAPEDIDERVRYTNQDALRDLPLQPQLETILTTAAANANVWVDIISGGQQAGVSRGVVGSHRHDNGYGADVRIYSDAERTIIIRTSVASSALTKFVQELRAAGALSIGAGAGYMGGRGIHVDIAPGNTVAASASRFWGANGRTANAPSWLSQVFAA